MSDVGDRAAPILESQVAEFERLAVLADDMRADIPVVVVRIVGTGDARRVVVFFRQEDFPDVLFGCSPMRHRRTRVRRVEDEESWRGDNEDRWRYPTIQGLLADESRTGA